MDYDEYDSYDFDEIPDGKKPICRKCPYFTHQFVPPTLVEGSEIMLVCGSI